MVQVDLITGFLGSGKTTFLRHWVQYLTAQGHNICILENDFGAVNVDVLLLQDVLGSRCNIESISGGCDCDTHQRRMRTKLISLAMQGYDRVVVEPSGIFDVDEFFDILRDDPLDRWYTLGNVFAVVDAALPPQLSQEEEYLLASEAAKSGCLLASRVQLPGALGRDALLARLNTALANCRCARRFAAKDILYKDWDTLTDADFAALDRCGWRQADYVKLPLDEHSAFTSLYFLELPLTESALRAAVPQLFADPACGHILRLKGFVPSADGWLEINATPAGMTAQRVPQGQQVLIVIGQGLDKAKIEAHLAQ